MNGAPRPGLRGAFDGKLAVVTGGGTGMGRELARQLSAEGCSVAICDVSVRNMADTLAICRNEAPDGTIVSSFVADVSAEADLLAFRHHVEVTHRADHLDLLFNNAGIGGGNSMLEDPRDQWEKVFNVNWGGVYLGVRTFLPMLLKSTEARIVNMSSVNGFWAGLTPTSCLVAYSAAKFAVKGFSEALIADLRLHAPNIGVSVVLPGHVGTSLVINSGSYLEGDTRNHDDDRHPGASDRLTPDGELRLGLKALDEEFRTNAPMTAAKAAEVILAGVHAGEWRILVGDDAHILDEAVRADPTNAYEPQFYERMSARGVFSAMPQPPAFSSPDQA